MPDLSAAPKPAILVYTEPLLARSMTFIRTQAEALTRFTPYYVSPRYLPDSLPLPEERVAVMHRGKGPLSRIWELPFKTVGVAPHFVRRLRKLNPALLHAHFGPMGLRAMPLARTLRIPLLVTFQGYDATMYGDDTHRYRQYSYRVYLRRWKQLEMGASLLIAVSHFIKGELIQRGFAANRIVVHYVGVDTELFSPDLDIERENIVLFVGRLTEKKGCEYLIRAMAKVQLALPHAELVIVGDGALRSGLEKLARQTLRHFRFLGFQPPEVVRHWMNRARVFAAPSVRTRSGDAEGYPNAFAEAQAMGLPVTSFDSDGVREAVSDGETGFLAPERDVDALANNLQMLLSDKQLCSRMGEAARRRVCTQFNLRIQTRKLEELYAEVLGRSAVERVSQEDHWGGRSGQRVAACNSQGK